MKTICMIVMTDGRGACLEKTMPSFVDHLKSTYRITRKVIHDDSGDELYREWLRRTFPSWKVIFHPMGRQGFTGAYVNAWRFLTGCSEDFVFSTEDDFVLQRDVDLSAMTYVLDEYPHLAQLALLRQPWNPEEIAAGGIIEQHPEDYAINHTRTWIWREHRRFWTTNPSLFRRSLCYKGWPNVEHSEGVFTHQLLEDPSLRFAFWGSQGSGEWVEHIGHERAGYGY